jgi:AcrR family transcriptional regulator
MENMARKARLGRPPDTNSAETRAAILRSARQLFAAKGYEATSNRSIAEEAGVTTGALYHYFDRKLDIFTAVYIDTQETVYSRFDKWAADTTTFGDRLRATLEAAYELNGEDPTLAQFLGSCRVDAARDPVLRKTIGGNDNRRGYFGEMVELGMATGEIDPAQASMVSAVLDTIVVGLVSGVSGDRTRHREAIDGVLALVEGKLVRQT